VCDAVGEGAASLVAAPFDWLAQAMGAAAGWLFEAVWAVFDTTTLVDVTKPGYVAVYNILFGVAVFVMLIFFCLQLITGLIHRDPTALTRAALGLAKSVLGSFVVITSRHCCWRSSISSRSGSCRPRGTRWNRWATRSPSSPQGWRDQHRRSRCRRDHHDLPGRPRDHRRRDRVVLPPDPQSAPAGRDRVRAHRPQRGASWDATKGWFGKWAMFVIA
jgi:hypothetical protein